MQNKRRWIECIKQTNWSKCGLLMRIAYVDFGNVANISESQRDVRIWVRCRRDCQLLVNQNGKMLCCATRMCIITHYSKDNFIPASILSPKSFFGLQWDVRPSLSFFFQLLLLLLLLALIFTATAMAMAMWLWLLVDGVVSSPELSWWTTKVLIGAITHVSNSDYKDTKWRSTKKSNKNATKCRDERIFKASKILKMKIKDFSLHLGTSLPEVSWMFLPCIKKTNSKVL